MCGKHFYVNGGAFLFQSLRRLERENKMSRQLEAVAEERNQRRQKNIIEAVEYSLEEAITHAGGVLLGFAFKDRGSDCLLVIKADVSGRSMVAFVGGENLGSLLIKAVRLGGADRLVWKADEYGT